MDVAHWVEYCLCPSKYEHHGRRHQGACGIRALPGPSDTLLPQGFVVCQHDVHGTDLSVWPSHLDFRSDDATSLKYQLFYDANGYQLFSRNMKLTKSFWI